MYPITGKLNLAPQAAVAIRCAPAPVSQYIFVLPIYFAKSIWNSELFILCAPK